jgi:hypothetical protein
VVVLGALALTTAAWNVYVLFHDDGRLTGRVVGPDGQPVAGALVRLQERTLTTLEPRATALTGPDGTFRFTGHRLHHLVLEAAKDGVGRSPRVAVRLYFRGQNHTLPSPLRLASPG